MNKKYSRNKKDEEEEHEGKEKEEEADEEEHHLKEHGRTCFRLEEQAPDFCAPAFYCGREIQVCLKDFRNRWLLLFFYSSDFTFV